jgi:hypothetical protein
MRKALRRVKKVFTSGSSSHDLSSHTQSDSMSPDSSWSVSNMPSPHRVGSQATLLHKLEA